VTANLPFVVSRMFKSLYIKFDRNKLTKVLKKPPLTCLDVRTFPT
jgi:hypothetical protein